MDMLYILVPIAITLVCFAAWGMRWALKTGQFDDLDSPASSILFDDDEHLIPEEAKAKPALETAVPTSATATATDKP
jgi:cbb3-type cytochrome oxidase maturation protein